MRQSELEAQLSALQASLEKHEQDAQAQLAAAQSQHAEQLTAAQSQHEEQLAAAKAALEEELTALKASKASAVSEAARVQEGYKAQVTAHFQMRKVLSNHGCVSVSYWVRGLGKTM